MERTRRQFLKGLVVSGVSGAVLSGLAMGARRSGVSAGARKRPNIIYVMLDDAGYGDFGGFGSEEVLTPVMERVCREGTKFTDHYSGSCVCAPTRCVLMTGKHTGHSRRRDNGSKANQKDFPPRGLVPLVKGDVTVAQVLKDGGYVTGGIGKWGLGNPGTGAEPEKKGFDYWYGYLDQVHAHDHYTDHIWEAGRMIDVPENAGGKKGAYLHDLFEAKTFDFVRRHKGRPFFLYLAYTLPHGKYEIPQDDPAYQPYKDKPWPQQVRNYAAMITRVDRTVGKVLDLLKELGLDEDTIVFYTSDNGPNAPFIKDLNSAGGLRGIKRKLYEGGIRAAMAVRWPGKVPAGRTSDFVWGMRDVFPTACEIAGVKAPAGLDGMSVLPTLLGKKQAAREHMYWEFHSPFQQAVRMGKWKGIRFGTAEPVELYDLTKDRGEENDVAAQQPEVVAKMERIMDESHVKSRYWPAVAKKSQPRQKKKQAAAR